MGQDAMILVLFLILSFKPALSLSSFTLIRRLFNSSLLSVLWPWEFLGKTTGVGCHFLLQGIFLTQDQTRISWISCIVGGFFTTEPPVKPKIYCMTQKFHFYKHMYSWGTKVYVHTETCANVHNNIIQNSQKVEMTQMSINWWIDKQKVVCLEHYSVTKKKWNTNTCHNMYEPWAKWKKANTKDHILHDSIYMKCP